jgi:regulator of replication initiation timing
MDLAKETDKEIARLQAEMDELKQHIKDNMCDSDAIRIAGAELGALQRRIDELELRKQKRV